jgi:hypothetical protein
MRMRQATPSQPRRGLRSSASLPGHSQRCSARRAYRVAHLLCLSVLGSCWGHPLGLYPGRGRRLQGGSGAGCSSAVGEIGRLLASIGLRQPLVAPPEPRAPASVWSRLASCESQHQLRPWGGKAYFWCTFLSRLSRSPLSLNRLSSSDMKFFATVLLAVLECGKYASAGMAYD